MNKTSDPLVSIVVPVYNHAPFVVKALESIQKQTYQNLEWIIIDDGSKDSSAQQVEAFIEKWKPKQCQFIKQENQGAHNTINRGLKMARGEYLTILNSDDYYHPERIQKLIDLLQATKGELAFSFVSAVDENDASLKIDHWWRTWYEGSRTLLITYPTVGFMLLYSNIAVSTGNLLFSKQLFEKVGLFKDFKLAHDLDFLLRALTLTEPRLLRENHYFYRLHRSNTIHQVQHLFEPELKAIYREYLTRIATPPENKIAPCHWYWPNEFAKARQALKMDRGLEKYLIQHSPVSSPPLTSPKPTHKSGKPITIVVHELSYSGVPKLGLDLACYLQQNGYQPRVFALVDGPLKPQFKAEGIPVYTGEGRNFVKVAFRCFKAVFWSRGTPIVCVSFGWFFIALHRLFKPWREVVWYIHEPFTPSGGIKAFHRLWRVGLFLMKLVRKFPPKLWFGSNSAKEGWEDAGFPVREVAYWSGMPSTAIEKSSPKPIKKILAVVGADCYRKGVRYLLDAFIECVETKKIANDVVLTIVGPVINVKGHAADLILRAVTSSAKEQIKIVSLLPPEMLDKLYEETDLFVMPSIFECLPLALLRAMSLGLPIITTNVNGCVEAIEDGIHGLHCHPYDSHSLAEALVKSINDPETSHEMGKAAQRRFNEKFAIEATGKEILNKLKGLSKN